MDTSRNIGSVNFHKFVVVTSNINFILMFIDIHTDMNSFVFFITVIIMGVLMSPIFV